MPIFEIEANGKTYEVDAPDVMTAGKAFQSYKPDVGTAEDAGKSFVSGVGSGVTGLLGMGGDIRSALSAGTDYVAGKAGIEPDKVAQFKDAAQKFSSVMPGPIGAVARGPTSGEAKKFAEGYTGDFYEPQTAVGKYANRVGEFAPGAIAGPGSLLGRLSVAAASGIGSEAAGQLTEGTKLEPYARVGGALAGGVAPAAAARVITPAASNPARQALVKTLESEGVTSLTAGQRTGNKTLQYAESILGDAPGAGQKSSKIQQEGQRQFTEAAMRRAGAGPDASPEVLAANQSRLGNEFERLSAKNTLVPDNRMITEISDAVKRYRNVPDSQQKAMLQGYIDDIIPHINAGGMPGVEYQPMRSMLSTDAKAVKGTDPYLSRALAGIRDALDNAMNRSISAADKADWNKARIQYGAQKTLEKSASRAGEATAEGQITPANLRNTVAANDRGAYARGEGNFSELARAGAGVMAPLPNSGTGQRVAINTLATGLGGGIGGLASGGLGAAAGAMAGAAAPAALGRVLMSPPVQAYAGNQLLAPLILGNSAREQALLQALLEAPRVQNLPAPK